MNFVYIFSVSFVGYRSLLRGVSKMANIGVPLEVSTGEVVPATPRPVDKPKPKRRLPRKPSKPTKRKAKPVKRRKPRVPKAPAKRRKPVYRTLPWR